jgi:hypothetical protein
MINVIMTSNGYDLRSLGTRIFRTSDHYGVKFYVEHFRTSNNRT